jgi:UDP-hydrolysing UDP-N-acetyl-D-glucosamine 2-epimerase
MSDNKKKICVVVASRANYGRIKSALTAINQHPALELQLVVGASALLYRFGKVVDIIRNDGFEVAAQIHSIIEGENLTTMAKSTGLGIIELATLFENLQPDVVLTVADRFETLSTTVAASYMNILVAHTQGGEVTGSIDESVRHAITKLAHIHFVATEKSRERVIRLGEDPKNVFNTGCPAIDVLANTDLTLDRHIFEKYGGVGQPLDPSKPFIVVLQHPVTTEFGAGLDQINETLEAVRRIDMQTVWLWPNADAGSDDISKGLRMYRERNRGIPLHFFRNFSVEDYACLIANCKCIVGNSSSGIREGAFLGTPVVNIGTRQNKRERSRNVVDSTYNADDIYAATLKQLEHGRYEKDPVFGNGTSGKQIAELLATVEVSIQKSITY